MIKIEFTDNEMGLILTALQCAMIEAGLQQNTDIWDQFDHVFQKCVKVNENRI